MSIKCEHKFVKSAERPYRICCECKLKQGFSKEDGEWHDLEDLIVTFKDGGMWQDKFYQGLCSYKVRVTENNGAVKDDGSKPMMHLFPPDALLGACEVMSLVVRNGRYPKGNWTGLPPERIYDALMRHLLAFGVGELIDPDTKLPHLDHLTCCAAMLRSITHGTVKPGQEVPLYMPVVAPDLTTED